MKLQISEMTVKMKQLEQKHAQDDIQRMINTNIQNSRADKNINQYTLDCYPIESRTKMANLESQEVAWQNFISPSNEERARFQEKQDKSAFECQKILIYSDYSIVTLGDSIRGNCKFKGGIFHKRNIYFIPWNANVIGVFHLPSQSFSTINIGNNLNGDSKFHGAVVLKQ